MRENDLRRGARLRAMLMRWYRRHARDLPWRRTRDPYRILVSEVMLQQTQVDRVIPKYRRFLAAFPSLRALADCSVGDVLRAWSGLGYNGRARRLWLAARQLRAQGGIRAAYVRDGLDGAPGIGRYTAAAVACFAFGARAAVVDTNVRRILSRVIGGVDDVGERRAWLLAEALLPRAHASVWNQALMDVGALYCRPRPRCEACPARNDCRFADRNARGSSGRPLWSTVAGRKAARPQPFEGSRRYYRGLIVGALARAASIGYRDLGEQVKPGFAKSDVPWLVALLEELSSEGLVAIDRRRRRARLP